MKLLFRYLLWLNVVVGIGLVGVVGVCCQITCEKDKNTCSEVAGSQELFLGRSANI